MSAGKFTEVTTQSWFSRLGGAFIGIIFGLIIFIISFPLLFWNEGRAVTRYKSLKEGGDAVISVSADIVEKSNKNKLIHLTENASTEQNLSDPVFNISANAIKLKRNVEMYQWKESNHSETKKKLGGGTETVKTYTYDKEWDDQLITSSKFKEPDGHKNPSSMLYKSNKLTANSVLLGSFTLSRSLIRKINNFSPLHVNPESNMPQGLQEKVKYYYGGFYVGNEPANPEVGDLKVSFEIAEPTVISVVSRQIGNSFEPYQTSAGGTIELLQIGTHSAEAMFKKAHTGNKVLTWTLRFVGFMLMLFGLSLIFRPLSVLADIIPLLGDITGAGIGIISFLLSLILSLSVVSIAWIFYRPLFGVILLAIAVALMFGLKNRIKSKSLANA